MSNIKQIRKHITTEIYLNKPIYRFYAEDKLICSSANLEDIVLVVDLYLKARIPMWKKLLFGWKYR